MCPPFMFSHNCGLFGTDLQTFSYDFIDMFCTAVTIELEFWKCLRFYCITNVSDSRKKKSAGLKSRDCGGQSTYQGTTTFHPRGRERKEHNGPSPILHKDFLQFDLDGMVERICSFSFPGSCLPSTVSWKSIWWCLESPSEKISVHTLPLGFQLLCYHDVGILSSIINAIMPISVPIQLANGLISQNSSVW